MSDKPIEKEKVALSHFLTKDSHKGKETASIAFDKGLKDKIAMVANYLDVGQKALIENILEDWLLRYSTEINKALKKKIRETIRINSNFEV